MMTLAPSFNFTRGISSLRAHTLDLSLSLSLLMKTDVLLMFSEDALKAVLSYFSLMLRLHWERERN